VVRAFALLSAAVALLPGGSNYSWYQVDHPQTGVCVREPYGVIANFDQPEAHAAIESELAQMYSSGQRRLRIGIFHDHGYDSGTVMDSTGGDLARSNRRNLAGLLTAVKRAGFEQVEVAFHPEGPAVREWMHWDAHLFEENWQLIRHLRPLIRRARIPYRLDLSNEAIPTRGQPLVLRYSRTLWRRYVRAYGVADTVGFSVIGDFAHVSQMRAVYGKRPPHVFDIHFYGGTGGLDEQQLFSASDRAMARQGLHQPWILGEAFYNDAMAARLLRQAINASRRRILYLTQWPLTRSSACADVDVGAPGAFDNYAAFGFGG
jgi:hypothetical protein